MAGDARMSGSALAGYPRVNFVPSVQAEDRTVASRAASVRSYTSPGEGGNETGRPGPLGHNCLCAPADIVWHATTGNAPGHDTHTYTTTSPKAAADGHVAWRRHLHGWRRHE